MVISVNIHGMDFELPKFTVDIAERMKTIGEITDICKKASAMYDFVSEIIDDETSLEVILDSKDVKNADLVELCNLYQMIDSAYADSMSAERDKRLDEQMKTAKSAIETLDKAQKVIAANGGNAKQGRQAFSGVA